MRPGSPRRLAWLMDHGCACGSRAERLQMFCRPSTLAVSARTRRQSVASSVSDSPYDGIMCLSLAVHALSSFAKQRSRTSIAIHTAVDAPGEAPSSATSEPSDADTNSVPNSRIPPRLASGLMICTRCPATSRRQSASRPCKHTIRRRVRRSLENLAYEIFGQIEVIPGDREQWADIARPDGQKEIEQRAVLEEFRREARVGSEQQRA